MPFLCTFHHDDGADHLSGRDDVEVQRLAVLGRRQNWRVGERCLELVKRLLGLDRPGEALVLLQESVEGQPLLAKPRNKAAQGSEAPQHLLDPLEVSNRPHPLEGCDLLRVGSIPHWETIYPNSMPRGTPKTHFSGFSFTPLAHRQSNATRSSLTRLSSLLVFTTMSST
jgi:hypothetical protein